MTIEQMHFLGEEIIVKKIHAEKEQREADVFNSSGMPHEKDGYAKFTVVKVGAKQVEYKENDLVLINQNGLPKEITVEGYAPIKDHYALMNHSRIFCKINE